MALWNIKNVKLAGVAGAVPDKAVDTHDFDFSIGKKPMFL